eukprot:gb/GEZN01010947.1/.p1 GENE.gb/GEZN01010947.1/~~gb/GEZN01010947.1/.p1  ORF type:complete len:375 (-),score=8.55 gb/GEZN01010947.1/:74-1162(-)
MSKHTPNWICVSCGNSNYPYRTECNIRKCRAARPPPTDVPYGGRPSQNAPPLLPNAGFNNPSLEPFPKRMRTDPYEYGTGGQNPYSLPPSFPRDNFYSTQETHHGGGGYSQGLGAPRDRESPYFQSHFSGRDSYLPPQGTGGPPGRMMGYGGRQPNPLGPGPMFDAFDPRGPGSGTISMFDLDPRQRRGKNVGDRNAPELHDGMWECQKCKNMNYASRTECNRRSCGAPKPAPEALQAMWECPKCGNINFPTRSVCNMRKCDAKKPAPGSTPLTKKASSAAPSAMESKDGTWQCKECGNINFPSRVTCNMRKCGAPRPKDNTGDTESTTNQQQGGEVTSSQTDQQEYNPTDADHGDTSLGQQ